MRFVKITVAIALLLLAVLSIIGEFQIVVDRSASTWHQHVSTILFISLCICAAYLLVRRPIDLVAKIHCPRCMALGGHTPAPSYIQSVNPVALHFGGFLLSVFYAGSKQQRFRCRECAELFYAHTAASRGYRLLFLLFIALIVVGIAGEFADL